MMAFQVGGVKTYAVSKVRLDPAGRITAVLWGRVDTVRNAWATAEVVDAIHDGAQVSAVFSAGDHLPERAFVIVEHQDGRECIAFDGAPSPGRNVTDLGSLDD